MCKLCHVHKVVCHTGHNFARFLAVIEAERKLFKMTEHIRTHLCLHTYTHNVSLVLNEIVEKHFADIKSYANVIESRLDDDYCTVESVLKDNAQFMKLAKEYNVDYVLIDDTYGIEIDIHKGRF